MGDSLSATASIVGLVVPALHGTRLLLDDLRNLKDAPQTVKRLTEDVQSMEGALQLLRGVDDEEWRSLGADVATQSKQTISGCTEACDIFKMIHIEIFLKQHETRRSRTHASTGA